MNHKESFCSQESGSVIYSRSVSLKFSNSNPPFHSRHVVFALKPDKANIREGSKFKELYLKKLLAYIADPCH